jgi:transcriptional regulator with XRE-family HTH domain
MTPHDTALQWADQLRAIAKQKKITQKRSAETSKVHPVSISQIFTGRRLPTTETLAAIAQAIGVELEWVEAKIIDHATQ